MKFYLNIFGPKQLNGLNNICNNDLIQLALGIIQYMNNCLIIGKNDYFMVIDKY